MEREVLITGIGGQGIQLMAKILAHAATIEQRFVMLFGMYMGTMRGGASDSTVVISEAEITAPPIIPLAWSLVAMHPAGLSSLLAKLRAGGLLLTNSTLVTTPPRRDDATLLAVPATRIAEEAGNILGAGMVAVGALAAATHVVAYDTLARAMRDSLPPHRQHLAEGNVRFLAAGAEYARSQFGDARHAAWPHGDGAARVA